MVLRLKKSVTDMLTNFVSPAFDIDQAPADWAAAQAKGWSGVGGVIGSPLGLLPILTTLYASGLGKLVEHAASKAFLPYRLPPEVVVYLKRRGLLKEFGDLNPVADLPEQGIDLNRYHAIEKTMEVMPTAQDIVAFEAHEVFEPLMIAKYGLEDEWASLDKSLFSQIGMSEEIAKLYWINHWQHASWIQIIELRRRGIITDDDVWDWFRLVEVPPYWRKNLTNLIWEVPTRVDVRRFWEMGTIDEKRLRDIYTAMGYHDTDLEDYVLWTKVFVAFPDLIARYKNAWINEADVKAELGKLGLKEPRLTELWQSRFKNMEAERTVKEKDLTKAEIYKAVKSVRLDRAVGISMIQSQGYDEAEATLLIDINVPPSDTDAAKEARLLSKSDIKEALKIGAITEAEALQRLLKDRYTPLDAALLVQIFTYVKAPPTETKQKEISKADIIKGVRDGLLEPEEAYILLQEIGYSAEAAAFILYVNPTKASHSLTGIEQFNALLNNLRKSSGQAPIKLNPLALKGEETLRSAQAKLALLLKRQAPESDIRLAQESVNFHSAQLSKLLK
jgi:hypothetical protein